MPNEKQENTKKGLDGNSSKTNWANSKLCMQGTWWERALLTLSHSCLAATHTAARWLAHTLTDAYSFSLQIFHGPFTDNSPGLHSG